MKYFIFLLLIFYNSNAYEKIPIYAPIDGIRSSYDLSGGRDTIFEDRPSNEACYGDEVSGETICVYNQIIKVENREECISYLYDNVYESVSIYTRPVKKGELVGYVLTKEQIKPKVLRRYPVK